MQFTDKEIQALRPAPNSYDKREGGGKGFAIRVHPSGHKSWIFFYHF